MRVSEARKIQKQPVLVCVPTCMHIFFYDVFNSKFSIQLPNLGLVEEGERKVPVRNDIIVHVNV